MSGIVALDVGLLEMVFMGEVDMSMSPLEEREEEESSPYKAWWESMASCMASVGVRLPRLTDGVSEEFLFSMENGSSVEQQDRIVAIQHNVILIDSFVWFIANGLWLP